MLDYLIENYLAVAITVFSVLVLLQLIKKAANKVLNIPGLVWWFVAWAMAAAASLITPQDCAETGWRCYVNAMLIYGALAIVLYPVSKRITTAIRDKFLPQPPSLVH